MRRADEGNDMNAVAGAKQNANASKFIVD